jgi:pyruvate/2-oxoglutarate dehydrogenase complex dihydrolipoamide dehydrogenase (E3) component
MVFLARLARRGCIHRVVPNDVIQIRHERIHRVLLNGMIQNVRCFSGNASVVHKDVLIVGGGPAGLVLSTLLSRMGVSNMVVEANSCQSDHPQAHFINTRTMEILRELGKVSSLQL